MNDTVPFGSGVYFACLALLLFARGTDFFSTWIATPNLKLEANPVAKMLGWKLGIPVNVAFCVALAIWPLPSIIIATVSVLIAAHNFQNAWTMRAFGEERYSAWRRHRFQEIGFSLYLVCLFGQTLLLAAVGGALVWFSPAYLVPLAIGWGILGYAAAVVFYTLLSLWRLRRSLG